MQSADGTTRIVDRLKFRKSVYQVEPIEIAVGDRLKFTRNDRALKHRNGQEFIVTALDGDRATIQFNHGQIDRLDLSQPQHLDYVLVSTVYASQGKTAERTLVCADRTLGKESFYVAVSRVKWHLCLYNESKADLLERAHTSKAKETAQALVSLTPTSTIPEKSVYATP